MPRTCTSGCLRLGQVQAAAAHLHPAGLLGDLVPPPHPTPPPDGNAGDGRRCRGTFPKSSMPALRQAQLSTPSFRGPALGHSYGHSGGGDNGFQGAGGHVQSHLPCVAEKH